jgi:hypothetical protein
MMPARFLFFIVCHFRRIRWRRNPSLEIVEMRRLMPIIRNEKDMWVKHLRPIDPLEETALSLVLQE